jgi:hypothetical protein
MPHRWFACRVFRVSALLSVVALVGGCNGEAEKTAPFPTDVKAVNIQPPKAATTPAKGMDRVGSESGTPNP